MNVCFLGINLHWDGMLILKGDTYLLKTGGYPTLI